MFMAEWNKGKPAANVNDLTGQRFGKLTVIEKHPVATKDRKARWVCKCDCGNMTIVTGKQLRRGKTLSCGCLRSEANIKKNFRHGGAVRGKTERLYGIYLDLKRRCYDPNRRSYATYGAKGIYVCDEWRDTTTGYPKFRDWAYQNGYYDQPIDTPRNQLLTIDRIDNDGPYAPWNCRWAISKIQSNNRGLFNQQIQDVDGTIMNFSQFEEKYNLKRTAVIGRLNNGWTFSQIIYSAHHPEFNMYMDNGGKRVFTDSDGFMHLIPKVDQSKARNHYGN